LNVFKKREREEKKKGKERRNKTGSPKLHFTVLGSGENVNQTFYVLFEKEKTLRNIL